MAGLTLRQTAARLGVSLSLVRKWLRQGRLASETFATPDGQKIILVKADAPRPARQIPRSARRPS